MASNEHEMAASSGDVDELTLPANYQPPAKKTLEEIIKQDTEDESLRKYKESLLGNALATPLPFPDDPRGVIVQKMSLLANEKEIELDLGGDLTKLKKQPLTIKEGCEYRIRVYFFVQREIVSGLKYLHVISRGPFKDKHHFMVGSYAPAEKAYSYTTQSEEAPKGTLARGDYSVKSRFTDDDGHDYLTWEWSIHIGKDWND